MHDSDDERAPFLHAADSALSPEQKRLTTRTILLYAAPSFALTVLYGSPYHVFAVKFYVDTLGVRPISISLATAVLSRAAAHCGPCGLARSTNPADIAQQYSLIA